MATITNMAFRINSFYSGEGMRQARRDIANLDTSMNALTKSSRALVPGMRDLVATALALGPALVPIAGGLLAIGAAAGSAFVSAGAVVTIYALAMKGAIEQTVGQSSAVGQTATALANAEKQLNNTAKGTKDYEKVLKKVTEAEKAHEAAIKSLPAVQEKFARSYDDMKQSVESFNDQNAKFTLGPATTMLEAFTAALPKFSVVIRAISPEIQRVATLTKQWVTDGGLDRFIAFLVQSGVPAFRGFVDAMRSLFGALGVGMRATAPLGAAFTDWLQKTMTAFQGWAEGGGFQRFMEWLSANSPALIAAAKDLGTFLANVGKAVGDMSGGAFVVFGVFLRVLASFPPDLLTALTYGFIAWAAALKIYALVAFVAAAATTAMTLAAAPFGLLMLGVALTIAAVVAAIIAVGVGIFFLVKYWDTVWAALKTAALAVWNALQVAWEYTWNAIKTAAVAVWNFLTKGWGQFVLLLLGPLGVIAFIALHWDEIWGKVKQVASAVWGWIQDAWATTTAWISDKYFAVMGEVFEAWNTVWPEMQQAASNVWNFLKAAWSVLWAGMQFVWDQFWGLFGPSVKSSWEGFTNTASAAWDLLKAGWGLVWSVIQGIYTTAWAILSSSWKIGWTFLTETAKIAWAILTGAWKVVWEIVKGVWDVWYALFSGVFETAWKTLWAILRGVWNVIKAAWDVLWEVITATFMVFLAIFTGNWGKAWKAIQEAAAAIWNLMKALWTMFLDVMSTLLSGFINTAKQVWNAFWTAIQNVAATFWNALKNLFQTFLTAVKNLWDTVWTAMRTIFQTIVTAIVNIATNAWATLRAALNTFLEFVKAVWNTSWTTVQNFFGTSVTALVNKAAELWTKVRELFNAGSNWLRTTFWNPVSNFFTKTIPDAFEKAANALGKGWDKIRKLVRDPIQAVVNVVYNNGIVKLWNLVAGVFGADKLSNFTLPAFKAGGSTGDGPGKDRGFPALLHPNEHVWTAREVAGAGGHEAVARMRSQALKGERVRTYGGRSFEDGGGFLGTGIGADIGPDLIPDGIIKNAFGKLKDLALGAIYGPFSSAVDGVAKIGKTAVRAAVPGSGAAMEKLGTGMIDKIATTIKNWVKEKDVAPTIAGGSVEAALAWARTQVGKPYQWGGAGPGGYDCSGFMSAIQNVIMGNKPNSRIWATAAFSGQVAPAGWKKSEKAPFMVGITNAGVGHTAGTLNGVNVESSGGVGVRVGGGARGYNNGMFGSWYGFLPSKTASGGTSPAQAKATAKGMLGAYGWSAQYPALDALWTRESGWRWNADNPSSDAYGIPQALPGSKMASAGADWKTNPGTQIKWGLGYIRSRYGSPNAANNFQKANNWYGYGTRSAAPGWGVVGDRGIELMKMRGGEDIRPLESLVSERGGQGVNLTLHIDARGATEAAVQRLETTLPDKLRMALEQGMGRRS
jgi:cell wall-associated NlpC family hydrolase/phage-related protein